MQRSVASRPWPNGLGGLETVPSRYPERAADTAAAIAPTRMTLPLGVDIAPRDGRDRRFIATPPTRKAYEAIKGRCRIDDAALAAAETTGLLPAQIVYRAARIDAEIEATAKILALESERARLGRWPPLSAEIQASRCVENGWIYSAPADGSMTLRISLEPAWEPSAKIVPQLDFRY